MNNKYDEDKIAGCYLITSGVSSDCAGDMDYFFELLV